MKKYVSNLAFVDLLFNLILGITFLFVLAFILINDPEKESQVVQKAEYMIILQWDDHLNVDIDLWVDSPSGAVGFRSPTRGFIYLDKDDLGHRGDNAYNAQTKQMEVVDINREVITIRGFQTGEYVVNAYFYFAKQGERHVNVTVEVLKLNPFEVVYEGKKVFTFRGQEETFTRFSMDSQGRFHNVNSLPKKIVTADKDSQHSGVNPMIYPSASH